MHRFALYISAVLLTACAWPGPAPAPDNVLDKNFVRPAPGALIVLLPAPGESGFELGEKHMASALETQLKAMGFRVEMLDKSGYEVAWSQEVAKVGGLYDGISGVLRPIAFGKAISGLAQRVCEEMKCAMIIQQGIVLRTAKLEGDFAEWDGQRQSIPLKKEPGGNARFTGTTRSLSVELIAVMADGGLGFRSYGGATLPFAINLTESKSELRQNLFQDAHEVSEAVTIALTPLKT